MSILGRSKNKFLKKFFKREKSGHGSIVGQTLPQTKQAADRVGVTCDEGLTAYVIDLIPDGKALGLGTLFPCTIDTDNI